MNGFPVFRFDITTPDGATHCDVHAIYGTPRAAAMMRYLRIACEKVPGLSFRVRFCGDYVR